MFCRTTALVAMVALTIGQLATSNAHAISPPGFVPGVLAQSTTFSAPEEGVTREFFTALGSGLGTVFGAAIGPAVGIDPFTGSLFGSAFGAVAGAWANRAIVGPYESPNYLPPSPPRPIWVFPWQR